MPATVDTAEGLDFAVRRDDWRQCRVTSAALPATLQTGQVLFRVDRFALTANNISYALTGDMLGYWTFFPAEAPWGRLPVMGFADVVRSQHPGFAVGERVFGFFPMSTHLVIDAAEAGAGPLIDGAPHRRDTALVYRQYPRVASEPLYDAAREDPYLLLRGLFTTSFLVDDFLADQEYFGARAVVISSASSKTAIALAFLLSRRGAARVIGLTSPRNRAFVERLGCYQQVLPYAEIDTLSAAEPVVFVDHSGDREVVHALHHHFGNALRHSGVVGATHWEGRRPGRDLPGPTPEFFFAPAQLEKRLADWGAAGWQQRTGEAWGRFLDFADGWLEVVRGRGAADVERAYREVLEGRALPHQGHVLSL
jgi:NADPH:quinone reductase-like Zn-dependent oxidoreductase